MLYGYAVRLFNVQRKVLTSAMHLSSCGLLVLMSISRWTAAVAAVTHDS